MKSIIDEEQEFVSERLVHLDRVQRFGKLGKWVWEVNTDKLYISNALIQLLGSQKNQNGDLSPLDILSMIHPDDREKVVKKANEVLKTKETAEQEIRLLVKDGRQLVVVEQYGVTLNDDGSVKTLYGYTKDITQLKQTETALRTTKNSLKQAQKLTQFISWEYELTTGQIHWTGDIEHILGIIPETIDEFAAHIHPNDLEFVIQSGQEAQRGKPYNIEYRIIGKNGKVKTIYEQAEVLFSDEGAPEVMYGAFIDVTDRKNTEQHLFNSDKLSLLGQLAAGVAHEIRNPLTSLRGFIQIMQSGIEEKKEYYQIMLEELNRIEFIVEEFLRLAKPQKTEFKAGQLSSIINHVIRLLESQTNLRNVQIINEIDEHLPTIYCDENQLKQVFLNLIKNAIEAIPIKGTGTIQLRSERIHAYQIKITITDNGVGIPQELLDKIGNPFFTTKENGTGLGIMVCNRIIQNHSGSMAFQSKQGTGTTVSILLPTTYVP